jgi:anti-sigma-K factor RskA
MTGPDDTDGMNPDAALALDYALGALGRDDRRAVEARLRSDPAFRALVEGWQAELSALDDLTAPLAPPAGAWDAIAAEIAPAPMRPVVSPRTGLWNSLALWRGLAFAGTAAAAIALASINPDVPAPVAPPRMLVAALADADGKPLLSAAYDPLRGAVMLTPATQRDDEGKSPELWVIEGDKPPRSLGVIDIHGPSAHAIAAQRLAGLRAGATLAITMEPMGGSTTGLPTGPVVASGKLSEI